MRRVLFLLPFLLALVVDALLILPAALAAV